MAISEKDFNQMLEGLGAKNKVVKKEILDLTMKIEALCEENDITYFMNVGYVENDKDGDLAVHVFHRGHVGDIRTIQGSTGLSAIATIVALEKLKP